MNRRSQLETSIAEKLATISPVSTTPMAWWNEKKAVESEKPEKCLLG